MLDAVEPRFPLRTSGRGMKSAELTFERDFKTGLRYRPFFGGSMTSRAVSLRVTPCLLECKFWLGDNGCKGSTDHPAISR
jgi:hypothetical protein